MGRCRRSGADGEADRTRKRDTEDWLLLASPKEVFEVGREAVSPGRRLEVRSNRSPECKDSELPGDIIVPYHSAVPRGALVRRRTVERAAQETIRHIAVLLQGDAAELPLLYDVLVVMLSVTARIKSLRVWHTRQRLTPLRRGSQICCCPKTPRTPPEAARRAAAPGETPCLWSSPAAIGQVRRRRSQAEPASEATTTARITTRIVPTRLHRSPRIASFSAKPIPPAPTMPRTVDSRTLMSQR